MKNTLNLFLLVFLFLQSVSAKNLSITESEKIVGKNLITGQPIAAFELTFSNRIFKMDVDSSSQYLSLQFRDFTKSRKYIQNHGIFLRYDLKSNQSVWAKKISFFNTAILQNDRYLIESSAVTSNIYDIETGLLLREIKKIALGFVDNFSNIGLGYKNSLTPYPILQGVDCSSGKVLWHRNMSRIINRSDIIRLNDSIVLMDIDGIHAIHLFNGKGWQYVAETTDSDLKNSALANGLGIGLGLLTSYYSIYPNAGAITGICSNMVISDSVVFMASKREIACLDYTGERKWQTLLPIELTSRSTLFFQDSVLFLVNKGFADMGYRRFPYGKPFIAAFDPATGRQLFLEKIQTEKKEMIDDTYVGDSTLYIYMGNKILKYSTQDGQLLNFGHFCITPYDKMPLFMSRVFVEKESIYYSFTDMYKNGLFYFTQPDKRVVLNDQLEEVERLDEKQVWLYRFSYQDYDVITQGDRTLVVNAKGQVVAEMNIPTHSIILGQYLYSIEENTFWSINMQNIFPVDSLSVSTE